MLIGLIYFCCAKYQEYRMHRGREVSPSWQRLHRSRRPQRRDGNALEMQSLPAPAHNFLTMQNAVAPLGDIQLDPQLTALLEQLQRQARDNDTQGRRSGDNNKKKKGGKNDKSAKKR
ncbi:MAG: hypothetical protein ACRC24_08005 [Vibrionaceae bacterium]